MAKLDDFPEPIFLDDWEDLGASGGMTNFGHRIDASFAQRLAQGKCFGHHAAWEFNGLVWQGDDGRYYEAVYRYHAYQETFVAKTLETLMGEVNAVWGDA